MSKLAVTHNTCYFYFIYFIVHVIVQVNIIDHTVIQTVLECDVSLYKKKYHWSYFDTNSF